jgi:hypothetical protein
MTAHMETAIPHNNVCWANYSAGWANLPIVGPT